MKQRGEREKKRERKNGDAIIARERKVISTWKEYARRILMSGVMSRPVASGDHNVQICRNT